MAVINAQLDISSSFLRRRTNRTRTHEVLPVTAGVITNFVPREMYELMYMPQFYSTKQNIFLQIIQYCMPFLFIAVEMAKLKFKSILTNSP